MSRTRFVVDLPAPAAAAAPVVGGGLLAGVAEADITPPPGMPKAGHSKNAVDGDGFRTRLRVRAFHLAHGDTSIVLLACDLLAGSAYVHREVALRIADLGIPASGLFMAVTHTHAGPGQYSGSDMYNIWAANRPGFDPAYTNFLIDQIVDVVRRAVTSRRPARAAFGTTEVWGATRNRSHGAHVRNDNVIDKRTDLQRPYSTIDPDLRVLRIDDAEGPIGVLAWFAIHGTGIRPAEPAYHADHWAYLNDELAAGIQAQTGIRPVAGSVVAAHGDMTPAVRPGMTVYPEAERVGRLIGAAGARLHADLADQLTDDFPIAAGLREIDLAARPSYDGVVLPAPRVGFPKAAGAQENLTAVIAQVPPFKAGSTRLRPHPDQGEKRMVGVIDPLHALLVAPDHAFPEILPIHLLRLGPAAVVGLPFEVTVEAGRRISEAVGAELADGPTTFISSLVDDHCDYLTTREEYAAQYYEGASTLFGPDQTRWVQAAATAVAADLAQHGRVEDVLPRHFDFGIRTYVPRPNGAPIDRRPGAAEFRESTATDDAHWRMGWSDVPPADLHWHEPLVRVEAEQPDGSWVQVADDQGVRMGVSHVQRRSRHEYAVSWYQPPLGRPGRHRFVLLANAGQPEVFGPPFD
ncbi:neutral ceramidase [Nocardioides baekrokdamisoli]|uniref:Neutral ceramidase n=1 Tax=Nocardioides baekrokdamisoli TaxID=1804624 RepID=A0A3G9IXM7_9ACTN|nr:neutral/alkaline non-lysosomal ceramidase N-terminal domain-containing protein [Nocardioides baekrokdamisoli]BBH16038.1 neutral ceramidase [Nocardioides baekrokdamisoli]